MRGEPRAMCVAADDDLLVDLLPLDDLLPDILPVAATAFPAWYASQAEYLQLLPDIPGHEPAHEVEPVALEINLMPVNDKDSLSGFGVAQNQPLVDSKPVFLRPTVPPILAVVVAHDEVQMVSAIKLVQQVKDASVGFPDVAKAAVL